MSKDSAPETQNTLYWHDYETWGEVPAQDKPSQFAGIRTDENLNIIGEPLMIYCQPSPDSLPKPEACLITGLTPQVALAKGLPEHQFAAQIHAELSRPGTCGVGYNTIRFDDEVTRYMLYRNFYDPYEREWRNGNSRWDIIDVVRMTRALRPEGIKWPNYEDGRPCFKLEMLTAANHLNHEAAHDALSDVYATIAMAKLIKSRQPKLFDYAYRLRDKRFVNSMIDIAGHKPLLHISSRFPAENGNAALVLPLAIHPTNKNSVIAYNLAFNPRDLLNLPADELRQRLFTRTEDLPQGVERIALKEIHLNKSPMVLPPSMLDEATALRLGIDRVVLEQHWQQLRNLSLHERELLQEKLYELYSEIGYIERTDPEQMLYDGFFDDADKKLMLQVRRSTPEQLATRHFDFKDARLPVLLFRYRARNFPHTLNPAEQQAWREFCHSRYRDASMGNSMLIDELDRRVAELLELETTSAAQKAILNDLLSYAHSL
ncbi:exodeoxyribonuclease I [Cellvibrio zantedeschiae]|uniref:Exodeoxyribonuclease I n=1 Tax=Cellvibrio zantedeschiae TaxID=1237077 RepID=A0ABQ3API3_9GAMM|nr:exodeoxyribonuclease I [Cellvibrio zantedeschiae]GGY63156.1 exodeoxyribonuclease I [Cellvibrio zantedeschiae]